MIAATVKQLVKQLLPAPVTQAIIAYRLPKQRQKNIQRWVNSGSPVPPPHQYKQTVIEFYQLKYQYKVLIETGTYLGDMVEAQKNNFDKIISIELGEELWKNAVARFKKHDHISIFKGDSGMVLKDIAKLLKEPAIFWLDGHYSEGITAKGDKDCPIFNELDGIFLYGKFNHILLVDDARDFNGKGDYPTIEALAKYVKGKDDRYTVEIKDDIIRFTI
jgi:hypothetical protein